MKNYTSFEASSMKAVDLTNALLVSNSGLNIDVNSINYQYGTTKPSYYNGNIESSISFYTPTEGSETLGISSGLLLSNGTAVPNESNTSKSYSTSLTPAGDYKLYDADLQNTAKLAFKGSGSVKDVTFLEFDFSISDLFVHGITFDLIFGSEEYPAFIDSSYVDIAGIYLNGKNIGLFNGVETQPLSVVSENIKQNNFQNNIDGHIPIEYNGVSNKLTVYAPVQPGTNSLKIAIGDTGDTAYDSGLYVANLSGTQLKGSGLSSVTKGTSGNDTIMGTDNNETFDTGDGDDYIDPGAGDDIILAGKGNDTIIGGNGNNQIDGGEGYDTVIYNQTFDSTWVRVMDNGTIHVGKNSDNLLNIEEIKFTDLTLYVPKMFIEDDIAKIYIAYFGRAADPAGMKYWVNQVESEVANSNKNYSESIFDVVSAYANSKEAEGIYAGINSGNLTQAEMSNFVKNIYGNLFNRAPEKAGLDYWVNEGMHLQDSNISVGTIVKTIIAGAQDQPAHLDRTYMQNKSQVSWNYAKQYELKNKNWSDDSLYNEAVAVLNGVTTETSSVNGIYADILAIVNG